MAKFTCQVLEVCGGTGHIDVELTFLPSGQKLPVQIEKKDLLSPISPEEAPLVLPTLLRGAILESGIVNPTLAQMKQIVEAATYYA